MSLQKCGNKTDTDMHEKLKKFWKDNENAYVGGEPTLIQPMTFWFEEHPDGHYRDEATGVKGFIFENHGRAVMRDIRS